MEHLKIEAKQITNHKIACHVNLTAQVLFLLRFSFLTICSYVTRKKYFELDSYSKVFMKYLTRIQFASTCHFIPKSFKKLKSYLSTQKLYNEQLHSYFFQYKFTLTKYF